MGVAVLNNCIYAIGGIGDDRGEINVPLKTVEKYSFARNSQWSLIAPLSAPRAGMAACVWQGKIFTVGGEASDSVNCGTAETFDPNIGKWSTIAVLRYSRIYPNAIVM